MNFWLFAHYHPFAATLMVLFFVASLVGVAEAFARKRGGGGG